LPGEHFALLPRRQWLAPLRTSNALNKSALMAYLTAHFSVDEQPVMVVCLRAYGNALLETRRGFVVANDWQQRAEQRFPASSSGCYNGAF
jgi:uncharacterized protein